MPRPKAGHSKMMASAAGTYSCAEFIPKLKTL
jgi:hypothetical protein